MTKCRACGGEGTLTGCKTCGKIKAIYATKQSSEQIQENDQIRKNSLNDLLELYSGARLIACKGGVQDQQLDKYAKNTDSLIELSKTGTVYNKFVVVASPNNFGKLCFLKTLRYYYTEKGTNVSPIRTLEEFMHNWKQYKRERGSLDFLLTSDLFLLTVLEPEALTVKQDIATLNKLSEIYSKPMVITVSASVNKVIQNVDTLSSSTYNYKVPTVIYYQGGERK